MQRVLSIFNKISKPQRLIIACAICLLISISAIWLKMYAIAVYMGFVLVCAFFYETNEIIILGSFGAFFTKCFGHNIFVVVIMVSLFAKCLIKIFKREIKLKNHFALPILITIVLSFMLVIINFNVSNMLRTFLPFTLLLSLELYLLRRELDLTFLTKNLIRLLILSCVISLILHKMNVGISVYYYDIDHIKRFSGLMPHMNTLSIWCVSLLSQLIFLFFSKKIGYYHFYAYSLMLCLAGIASMSKSFLVIGAVLLIIYLICTTIKSWKFGIVQIFIIVLAGVGFCLANPTMIHSLYTRFLGYSGDSIISKITTGRYNIWVKGINAWLESAKTIILGVGGSYKKNLHNTFIEILVKYGVVGAILVCVFISYFIVLSIKSTIKKFYNYIPLIATLLYMFVEEFSSGQFVAVIMSFFAVYNFAMYNNKKKVLIYCDSTEKGIKNGFVENLIDSLSPEFTFDVIFNQNNYLPSKNAEDSQKNYCIVWEIKEGNKILGDIKQIRFFTKHKNEYGETRGIVAYNAMVYGNIDKIIISSAGQEDNTISQKPLGKYLTRHYSTLFVTTNENPNTSHKQKNRAVIVKDSTGIDFYRELLT